MTVGRVVTAVLVLGAVGPTGASYAQPRDAAARLGGTSSIHGRVLAADTDTPVPRARVLITRDDQVISAVFTDADGRFVTPSLAPGGYRVAAAKSGYVTTSFGGRRFRDAGAVISVADKSLAGAIELHLPKAAAISGRILDSRGDPVVGMTVTAEMLTADPPEQPTTLVVATTELDDLGEYRLGGLPDGTFVVSVNVVQLVLGPNGTRFQGDVKTLLTVNGSRVPSDALGGERRTYYPGVADPARRGAITLALGEERASVDFAVQAMPPLAWSSVLGQKPLRSPQGTGVLRGRVARLDGSPLPSVPVRLLSDDYPGIPPSTSTDSAGRFELSGLPPATYRVMAERSGFLDAEYGQRQPLEPGEPIALKAGESRERIDITLAAPGAIAGRVLDDQGDPVEGAHVRILQARYEAGRLRLDDTGGLGSHRTDDLGRYRIYGLSPGTYLVSAGVGQLLPGRVIADLAGYAPTYFPGTPNPAEAQWLNVNLSGQATGIDFSLSRIVTARVEGIRFDEAGRPAEGSIVLSPSRRSGAVAPMPVGARTYPGGRFEFPNVPPGEYVVQASTPRTNPLSSSFNEGEFASVFVTVNGIDVTGLIVRTSTGSTIKGRVTVDGSSEAWLWSEITLSALPLDLDRSPLAANPPASAGIRADWTFELAGISGPRLLRLTSAPRGWALKAVMLNGVDVTDRPLPFGTKEESIADVEVILTDRVSEISGTVVDARGRGLGNCQVVVFATDRALWGPATRFVTVSRSGRDGAFSVRRLPATEYFIAAVDRLIEGEWQNPDLLESLVPVATRVALGEGDTVSTTARLALR